MGAFRLDWLRDHDRHIHTVFWCDQQVRIPLFRAETRELDLQCPIVQHVEHPTPEITLGVGMVGANHWSLSIERQGAAMRFDLACRQREAALLGCAYRIDAAGPPWALEAGEAAARWGEHEFRLAGSDGLAWDLVDGHLVLQVELPAAASLPRTVRCRYTLTHRNAAQA